MTASPHSRMRQSALHRIKTAMIEKKLTQAELAEAADCHEKTVQNLLNGRTVRDQTLFDVCMVLGLDFDEVKVHWTSGNPALAPAAVTLAHDAEAQSADPRKAGAAQAPVFMGAYTRAAVDHYIGAYVTIRPAFHEPGVIVAYRTDIAWDDATPALAFKESWRTEPELAHLGHLYVPPSSSFVHFVSLTKGAMRMVLAWQIDQKACLRGLMTTLSKSGPAYTPICAPVIYTKKEAIDPSSLGRIPSDHKSYASYANALQEAVAIGYVRLLQHHWAPPEVKT